ncbi:hypothetical protein V6N11_009065 [Hibiscus sabdariffa]|uniref:Uncharacterized protein n=1 Tax=Hibiscus sabdariffa TaxID=183260 RepID=A0ABR2PPX1_9ROSI
MRKLTTKDPDLQGELYLFSAEATVDTVLHQLQPLLLEFQGIFAEPKQLPPSRSHDHAITLKPESQPINLRSYSFLYHQKLEVEKQISELLAASIIQDSRKAIVAFQSLKDAMSRASVLALPNFSKSFNLEMDASIRETYYNNSKGLDKAIEEAKKDWTYAKRVLKVHGKVYMGSTGGLRTQLLKILYDSPLRKHSDYCSFGINCLCLYFFYASASIFCFKRMTKGMSRIETTGPALAEISAGIQVSTERLAVLMAYV